MFPFLRHLCLYFNFAKVIISLISFSGSGRKNSLSTGDRRRGSSHIRGTSFFQLVTYCVQQGDWGGGEGEVRRERRHFIGKRRHGQRFAQVLLVAGGMAGGILPQKLKNAQPVRLLVEGLGEGRQAGIVFA